MCIMWRLFFLLVLFTSVSLNVYLFMKLNIHAIENTLPQSSFHQDNVIKTTIVSKKNVVNNAAELQEYKQNLPDEIKQALIQQDYYLASFLINGLADKNELAQLIVIWLQNSTALLAAQKFVSLDNSISAYLEFNADDQRFLYLQVESELAQGQLLVAIKHAYDIQYHVFTEAKKVNVINAARELVQEAIAPLIKNNLWLELKELVVEISLYDQEYLYLQWVFSQAQYQLGELELARNSLEPLLMEPNFKVKAQALYKKIELSLQKTESIALSRQGAHFIVQATINNNFNVALMLDTGASISLLSEQAFEQLNQYSEVVYVKDLRLNTAGGQVTASLYQVAEFDLQGYVLRPFVFAVSPFMSEGSDGLLGMNYLSSFDFHIDQTNNLLILKNK